MVSLSQAMVGSLRERDQATDDWSNGRRRSSQAICLLCHSAHLLVDRFG
jgi:hypothetical protein